MARTSRVLLKLAFILILALAETSCARGARVISVFSERYDAEGRPRDHAHMGVDVWGNPGDPVLASAHGRVVVAEEAPRVAGRATCGKYLVLDHEQDLIVRDVRLRARTKYCHLSEHAVTEGKTVKRGEVIGYIGTTGWRTTPRQITGYEHVHWELLISGGVADPIPMTVGCFDPKQTYPTDRLVLTYPVKC